MYTMSDALTKAGIEQSVADQFSHIILPFELMVHQYDRIRCGLSWDRFGLFDQPRTGKTIVMQIMAIYFAKYGMKSVFLMPPVLFRQFERDFHLIKSHGISIKILNGLAASKTELLRSWALHEKPAPDVLVMTREMFAGPKKNSKNPDATPYVNYLTKAYSLLFWDECHLGLQEESTAAFRAVEQFIHRAPHARVILSTGTPLTAELKNAYPIIRLKTPDRYESRRAFDDKHVNYVQIHVKVTPTPLNPRGLAKRLVVDSYKNVDLLRSNFYTNARRILRSEVSDCKVPKILRMPVELDPKHLKAYKAAIRDKIVELNDEIVDLRTEQALRQYALQSVLDPALLGCEVKKNAIVSMVEHLVDSYELDDNKVVLFANYNKTVELLEGNLKEYNPVTIFGKNTSAKNAANATAFQTGKESRVAVINPQAGGVGLKLGDVSNVAIFVEPLTVPGWFEQAAARVITLDKVDPPTIVLIEALGTYFTKAIDKMIERYGTINEVQVDSSTLIDDLTETAVHTNITRGELLNELIPG